MGEDYYPLPWSVLTYNESLGGYVVNLTEEQLDGAPRYSERDNWDWGDQSRIAGLDRYYNTPPLTA